MVASETQDQSNPEEQSQLAPNIKLQVSYDQKTMTFKQHWPSDLVAGKAKSETTSNERMLNYENVHEIVTYDQNGYLHISRTYLEGNADLAMPENLYKDVKDDMPAHSSDYDPVVRSELGDGTLTYYTKSGKVAYQTNVDKEKLRIDPAILDSLQEASQSTSETENRIAENLAALKEQNIDFKQLSNRNVLLEIQAKSGTDDKDIANYKKIVDLSINRVIRSAIVRKDGRYANLSLMNYKKVSGHPVMASSETLYFGMVNGKWGVKTRTIRNRKDINVHFNTTK